MKRRYELQKKATLIHGTQCEVFDRLMRELNMADKYSAAVDALPEDFSDYTSENLQIHQKYWGHMNSAANYRKQLKNARNELNKIYKEIFDLIK